MLYQKPWDAVGCRGMPWDAVGCRGMRVRACEGVDTACEVAGCVESLRLLGLACFTKSCSSDQDRAGGVRAGAKLALSRAVGWRIVAPRCLRILFILNMII